MARTKVLGSGVPACPESKDLGARLCWADSERTKPKSKAFVPIVNIVLFSVPSGFTPKPKTVVSSAEEDISKANPKVPELDHDVTVLDPASHVKVCGGTIAPVSTLSPASF